MVDPQYFPQATHLDIERAIGYTGDAAAAADLLRMVEQSLGSDIDKIWKTLEMGDVASAGRLIHAIKGFAPMFCHDLLIEHVTRAEALSKTESAASFKLVFADLAPELLLLLKDIRSYLSDRGTPGGG
ncbi:hypothetical protein [Rhodoferax sp.]|uniref:hypothetical protein n=1 Tax=Rhodoferax sp. TaxID=50421 RepID=UPI002717CD5B|nr:hypothetical protein [Rhodoferax sp.]MDO9198425.1 hypothetical protein [Rhodoferax sp.]